MILDRISGLWPDVKNRGGKSDLLFKAHVFLNFAWNGLRQSIAVTPAHTRWGECANAYWLQYAYNKCVPQLLLCWVGFRIPNCL